MKGEKMAGAFAERMRHRGRSRVRPPPASGGSGTGWNPNALGCIGTTGFPGTIGLLAGTLEKTTMPQAQVVISGL
jgi:hypothetical protein